MIDLSPAKMDGESWWMVDPKENEKVVEGIEMVKCQDNFGSDVLL